MSDQAESIQKLLIRIRSVGPIAAEICIADENGSAAATDIAFDRVDCFIGVDRIVGAKNQHVENR